MRSYINVSHKDESLKVEPITSFYFLSNPSNPHMERNQTIYVMCSDEKWHRGKVLKTQRKGDAKRHGNYWHQLKLMQCYTKHDG